LGRLLVGGGGVLKKEGAASFFREGKGEGEGRAVLREGVGQKGKKRSMDIRVGGGLVKKLTILRGKRGRGIRKKKSTILFRMRGQT